MSEKLCALRKIGGGKVINSGDATVTTSASVKITLGYRPKYLTIGFYKDSIHTLEYSYWSTKNSTQMRVSAQNGSSYSTAMVNMGTYLTIQDDGFTIMPMSSANYNAYGSSCIWYATEE